MCVPGRAGSAPYETVVRICDERTTPSMCLTHLLMSLAAAAGKAIENDRRSSGSCWCSKRSALTPALTRPVPTLPYPETVRTVVFGPPPAEISALIARRRALGLDTHDEVWEGEYHMAPAADVAHGWVDQQLAQLLAPLAAAAGLVATGPFNLGSPARLPGP